MASGAKHTAEYYRQRRAKQRQALAEAGTPLRQYGDFVNLPRYQVMGEEIRAMMREPVPRLPWPRSLFQDQPALIDELVALDQRFGVRKVNSQDLCGCGCGHEHKHRISQTARSPYGSGWQILYFASDACKSRYNQQKAGGK